MNGMTPKDIGSMAHAGEVRVSPDGATVAFTVLSIDLEGNDYGSRIWLGPTDGSSSPYPFSAGESRDFLPRWSPDGRRLAFVTEQNHGLSETPKFSIVVMPVTVGGQAVRVALLGDEVSELEWSPDSSRVAFVARQRDESRYGTAEKPTPERGMPPRRLTHLFYRLDTAGWTVDRPKQVFVASTDGSPVRALTAGPFDASDVSWSPDGRRLAFVSARHETWDLDLANDLWVIDSDGSGEPARVTASMAAGTTAHFSLPVWSPDGDRLACHHTPTPLDEPRHTQVAVVDVKGGTVTDLSTPLDLTCAPFGATRAPVWDGENVLFTAEDAGNVHLFRVTSGGAGKPELLLGGDQTIASWDLSGGVLAYVSTAPTALPDLFAGESGRKLTRFAESFATRFELSAPVRFVATSADGSEVECWAIPPVGAEPGVRYPTLLNIHGGPYTQYGNRFFDEFQVQAGAGFGVVYCNPRGSSGYTEAWARAIRWPEAESDPGSGWGGVDYEDVMACTDEAARRFPWVDPERLGVMGGSYGGYMTSWIVGHTNRFRAACSERACNNLLSLEQTSDIATAFRAYVGKSHLDDPAPYLRHSPISFVREMSTPMLIVHSEQDLRCPVSQAEELFVALRMLGRQPEMVRFPSESHELSRSGSPAHRVMRAELILDWFREHL